MSDRIGDARFEESPSPSVGRLLVAVRNGEPEAFGPLFDAFRRHLLLAAHRELPVSLRGKVGPSDLVQETAVDARRDFPSFRGSTAEECFAWLRSILRNNVVDAVRRYETAQKRAASREISLASPVGRREGKSLEMPNGPPDGSAIRREDAALLSAALERLSADHQAVLRHRYWDGLSFVDIGTRLGRSPDAVRKLWYRAVERLQEEMSSLSRQRTDGADSSGADSPEPAHA